jgi:hypothetical protein
MLISPQQLEAWSHQGSVSQSTTTYKAIKSVLEDKNAPYAARQFDIYLQGSYGNDTNVYAESDVDIVICLTEVYNFDVDNLSPSEKAAHDSSRLNVDYGFDEFKRDVSAWLRYNFGSTVKLGSKAIFVPGNGNRRDADIIPCIEHRRFTSYSGLSNIRYHEGICFWATSGRQIVNFPKQHSDNCTAKHQQEMRKFKPMVRIIKNMRNAMVDDGLLRNGVAPSYFLEGALWNMPSEYFGGDYQKAIENFLYWFGNCDRSQLTCANGLHWLIRDGADVCWNMADAQNYIATTTRYWNSSTR